MFEFYRIVVNPDTGTEEIKKFRYEETPETKKLKEKLEKEIDKYERHTVTWVDRYYHLVELEETVALNLSQSVFDDDVFVGYMIDDIFYVMPERNLQVYEDVQGATSVEIIENIRRKDNN